ncbi:MAG: hypothetical protein JRH17_09355 [Deltaproteobacteria bacterium]|nr:hypothetical protein [Deltaproteobacteria bacterium]
MGRLISLAAGLLLILGLGARSVAADPNRSHGIGGPENPAMSVTTLWMHRSDLVVRALSAMDEGDTEAVIEAAKRALLLPLRPIDRLAALNALCVGYVMRGMPGVALEYCDRVVRESRSDWRALNNRANAQIRRGHIEAAIRDYQLAAFKLAGIGETSVRHYGSPESRDGYRTVSRNLELARRKLYEEIEYAAARSLISLR